jgi:hypothetical protein
MRGMRRYECDDSLSGAFCPSCSSRVPARASADGLLLESAPATILCAKWNGCRVYRCQIPAELVLEVIPGPNLGRIIKQLTTGQQVLTGNLISIPGM